MFRKIVFSSSILLLAGLIWFFGSFSSDRQCIKSIIVSELVIKDSSHEASIYSCRRLKDPNTTLSLRWKDRIRKLNAVLVSYTQVFEKIYTPSWSIQPVRIVVSSENPYGITYKEGEYIIGPKVMDRPWILRRFVAEIFVRDRLSPSPNDVLKDILSDLLTSYVFGDLKLFDHHADELKDVWSPNMRNWIKDVRSIEGICEGIWRSYVLEEFCNSKRISDANKFSGKISKYSLRSFVYQLNWYVYKKFNSKERILILSWFWENVLEKTDWALHPNTYSSFESFLRDAVTLSMQVMGIDLDVENHIFYEDLLDVFYMPDIVVASDKFDNERMKILNQFAKKDKDLNVYWRVNDKMYILPNTHPISLSDQNQVVPSRRVMEYCQEVNVNMFAHSVSRDERLLAVDVCGETEFIDYMTYLKGGLEAFARAHPKVGYVSYHLPSVKLAQWQGLGDDSIMTFQSFSTMNAVEKLLGLENPVKSHSGYTTNGKLKAVESYRPTNKKHSYLDIKSSSSTL